MYDKQASVNKPEWQRSSPCRRSRLWLGSRTPPAAPPPASPPSAGRSGFPPETPRGPLPALPGAWSRCKEPKQYKDSHTPDGDALQSGGVPSRVIVEGGEPEGGPSIQARFCHRGAREKTATAVVESRGSNETNHPLREKKRLLPPARTPPTSTQFKYYVWSPKTIRTKPVAKRPFRTESDQNQARHVLTHPVTPPPPLAPVQTPVRHFLTLSARGWRSSVSLTALSTSLAG